MLRQEVHGAKPLPRGNAGLSLVAIRATCVAAPFSRCSLGGCRDARTDDRLSIAGHCSFAQTSEFTQSLSPVMLREATRGAVPL